jgi:hypothetical protein
MIQIFCKNTGSFRKYPEGTSLLNMLPDFEFERSYPIVSARVNGVSQGLKFKAWQNKDIEFIDLRDTSGMRVYCRSLCFLLSKSAGDVLPDCKVYMEHPISNGFFCNIRKKDGGPVTEEDIRAIMSHGYGICTDVEPLSAMEKSLFTVDELSGIIQAAARMRPKGITDMEVKSFMKKWKDKKFAAKCDRPLILKGCEMLGMDIKDVSDICISGMKEHAAELQLTGAEE